MEVEKKRPKPASVVSTRVQEDASCEQAGSDTEDSVKGKTVTGSSKRSRRRPESARGPARKAARWLKSMVKNGMMTAEQKDAMLPEERKRLHYEMLENRASLRKDILTHHQHQSSRLAAEGTDLIHEMLAKGVWTEEDVKACGPVKKKRT
eukprot:s593_g15.t1